MVRTREELTKIFSDEVIDHEIERVKRANDGDVLFFMESWEVEDFVVSVLSYANLTYYKQNRNGMSYYIKGEEQM